MINRSTYIPMKQYRGIQFKMLQCSAKIQYNCACCTIMHRKRKHHKRKEASNVEGSEYLKVYDKK